jgi:hypothetical protein
MSLPAPVDIWLEEDLFGDASAVSCGQAGFEVLAGVVVAIAGQVDGDAESHAARNDGDLVDGVGVVAQDGDESVTGLVIRGDLLLFVGEQHRLALGAHEDLVFGDLKVVHGDLLAVDAGGVQGCFVDHIGQVGAGEAGCSASQNVEVDVFGDGNLFDVNAEYFFAATNVGKTDDYAAVKTAGAQKRGIEDVGAVGGGDQDHAVVGLEAVHFDEELIQGLLALIVSAAEACAAMAADGVDFVDEDDAGGVLLALLEEVANAAAPTPTNISTKSEPEMEKNGTLASPATARASRVLPVPGGPTSRTPLGMRPPSFWKRWGSRRYSMISLSSSLASSTPATSLKVTFSAAWRAGGRGSCRRTWPCCRRTASGA